MNDVQEWLKIARSNLKAGKIDLKSFDEEIRYEEGCYNLQQSVEKALKALLLHKNIKFPKTHDISDLLKLLIKSQVEIPECVLNSSVLTFYAIQARYPDNYHETTKEDYHQAIQLADDVYNWVVNQIE